MADYLAFALCVCLLIDAISNVARIIYAERAIRWQEAMSDRARREMAEFRDEMIELVAKKSEEEQ